MIIGKFDYGRGLDFDSRDMEPMSAYERDGDDMDYLNDALWGEDVEEEDVLRCEIDTKHGGVCLTRIKSITSHCPNNHLHAEEQ